jgi:hypothetical protein
VHIPSISYNQPTSVMNMHLLGPFLRMVIVERQFKVFENADALCQVFRVNTLEELSSENDDLLFLPDFEKANHQRSMYQKLTSRLLDNVAENEATRASIIFLQVILPLRRAVPRSVTEDDV